MKRFNYTGRAKLFNHDIRITLHSEIEQIPIVDIFLNVSDYEFPDNVHYLFEAHRQTRFERHKLPLPINNVITKHNIKLSEFDDSEGLKFRVKVVNDEGCLLGVAENVKFCDKSKDNDPNQQSILPVLSKDLSKEGVLWRTDLSGEDAVLEVDLALGSREQVVRSTFFRGFILPAALNEILKHIIYSETEWDSDLSDPSDLSTKWIIFSKQLGAGVPPQNFKDNIEDARMWVEETLRLFSRKVNVRDKIIKDVENKGWQ